MTTIIKAQVVGTHEIQLFYNRNNGMYYIRLNDNTIQYDTDASLMMNQFELMVLKLKIKYEKGEINDKAQKNLR